MRCAFLVSALVGLATAPCLWDADTLDDELRGLPAAFDLAIGRFHRHSEAYYRARIALLSARPDLQLADYDDLAVAHEHLGERAKAIEAMRRKAQALALRDEPVQRYRYHANLGTFYAHDGRYDEAIAELERAVAIDKEAHFGRERYQIDLLRFARDAAAKPGLWEQGWLMRDELLVHIGAGADLELPIAALDRAAAQAHASRGRHRGPRWEHCWGPPLARILARREDSRDYGPKVLDVFDLREPDDQEWQEVYTAVAGMLRFGGREGPELYRSLGLLFLSRHDLHLAWWSLQHAIERGHPAADNLSATIASIESHWSEAAKNHAGDAIAPTMDDYRRVRAATDAWVAAFQELEAAAIARGEDVRSDAALAALLAAADTRAPRPSVSSWWRPLLYPVLSLPLVQIAALALVIVLVRDAWLRRRARRTA